MSTKKNKKNGLIRAIPNKTLNLLLAAAVLLMLLPFGRDLFLFIKERNSNESINTDASLITVMDDSGILSQSETEALKEAMLPVTAYFPVAFVTTDNTGGTSAAAYSLRVYNDLFDYGGGILFLIDFDTTDSDGRQIYLRATDQSSKLSVSKCNTITDNVYTYARDGEYFECARQTFLQAYDVLADRAIPEPMKHMSNLLIAVCFALYIVFRIANSRTKIKTPGEIYLLDNNVSKKMELNDSRVRLVKRYTVTNASSGGGGGGGFSGGGGGGGGGGSHGGGHGF